MARHDRAFWSSVESDFVQGVENAGVLKLPTIRELSRKYKVSARSISKHISAEWWNAKRAEYTKSAAYLRTKKEITEHLERRVKSNRAYETVATAFRQEAVRALSQAHKLRGPADEPMSATAAGLWIRVLKEAFMIERLAAGEATVVEERRTRTEAELEAEQAKLASVGAADGVDHDLLRMIGLPEEQYQIELARRRSA